LNLKLLSAARSDLYNYVIKARDGRQPNNFGNSSYAINLSLLLPLWLSVFKVRFTEQQVPRLKGGAEDSEDSLRNYRVSVRKPIEPAKQACQLFEHYKYGYHCHQISTVATTYYPLLFLAHEVVRRICSPQPVWPKAEF